MKIWDKKKSVDGEWEQIEKITSEEEEPGKEGAGDLIVLEKEHQRFYDKLRKKIEDFISKQSNHRADAATPYILLAPDFFVLMARLLKDKRVSAKSKTIAGIVVAYFISPLDIIPELISGPIGFLDDIILAAYAVSRMMNDVDKQVLLEHWNGKEDLLQTVQNLVKKAEDLVDKKVLGLIGNVLNKKK
ncbi:YkvA family protein [Ammoniphilus resinae]|uniref:Uncharacterized membrane protein YkvA (DUF1232 family) n=1 Tax=Ammoniphilus resinae TaxID=861532 RepID=A0ABS4GRF5_9BACL|nr:YkvA family protein [Ammoniphilus resinae]MBP1932861.1 uncharacterized membrane protein YkvA (DUF1232 family) [Ammoniphilus resinae]